MECYQHEFKVTDNTPYLQRGWPIPLAYKQRVDAEINKMLKHGVMKGEIAHISVSYTHLHYSNDRS